ncbi:MAG TPA: caspase family protein, partial [Vicinamibacterales bacterium]|nr:caspase family protein [Vicinamibacterales bacterium]
DDIAQHLTIDPQGLSWTGRNWNLPPASQAGMNGSRQKGPFMIEIVGDFDDGRDPLDGLQRQAAIDVVAAILHVRQLGTGQVFFHRDLGSPKSCPGSGVDKVLFINEIQAAIESMAAGRPGGARRKPAAKGRAGAGARGQLPFGREFLLGHDVTIDPGEAARGYEAWEVPEHDLAAGAIQADARARARVAGGASRDLSAVLERTRPEWEVLRPHVVNLSRGLLSQGGQFTMPDGSIDGIVEAIRQYAHTTDEPRVMMHAHGGLIKETDALAYALGTRQWWLDHGIFPVYFVWETGAFEVIRNRLGLGRGIGDWWDRRFERFARPLAKPLWDDMKDYALRASSPDAEAGQAGGAWIFTQALSSLVGNPPPGKSIALHAVGHSAGAIFHAHLIPALVEAGMKVESLAYLAPAVRIDLFKQLIVPRLASADLRHFEMYTMDEEAERGDDLVKPLGIPVYGKSLLYLISGAFEPEDRHAGILGLEERLTADEALVALFEPAGRHRLELSHARGKPHNPATRARKHGCFDNDDATMRSVLATIAGASTDIEFSLQDESCNKAASRDLAGWYGAGAPAVLTGRGPGSRVAPGRALCVGIDGYPTSPLLGCVRDAQAWARVLGDLRFDVTTVLDREATRQRVLDALGTLVESAEPGGMLVFQYSGHGSQAPDLDGDESDRYDEALVPIDYQSGALLLDDDLADVYRRLPDGALLTLFMDCCHSGTNSRFAPFDVRAARGDERRRFLPLTPELEDAHRQYRARAGSPRPTSPEESLPGLIHFAACLDDQFAYESDGHGHFTRVATADLAAAVSRGMTNEDFSNDVAARVIALGRPQTPRLMRLPATLAGRALLAGTASPAPSVGPQGAAGLPAAGDPAWDDWCLEFFEAGAAHWRARLGR